MFHTRFQLLALGLLPGLAILGTAVQGQAPVVPLPGKVHYTKNTTFKLPVKMDGMDEKARAGLREDRIRAWAIIRGAYQGLPLDPGETEETAKTLRVVRALL